VTAYDCIQAANDWIENKVYLDLKINNNSNNSQENKYDRKYENKKFNNVDFYLQQVF
jgi:hypothetical protein